VRRKSPFLILTIIFLLILLIMPPTIRHKETQGGKSNLLWKKLVDRWGVSILEVDDLNKDGYDDIIAGGTWGSLYALNGKNGELLWYSPLGSSISKSMPGISDINNDGYPDVIFGTGTGFVRALNGLNGSLIWKYYLPTSQNLHAGFSPIVISDLNSDGYKEVLFTFTSNESFLLALNGLNGSLLWKVSFHDHYPNNIAIYDMNDDGVLDIIVTTVWSLEPILHKIYVFSGIDGELLYSFDLRTRYYGSLFIVTLVDLDHDKNPEVLVRSSSALLLVDIENHSIIWKDYISSDTVFHPMVDPAIADIDNDDEPEIIVAGNKTIYLINMDGTISWRHHVDTTFSNPVIGDIDGDNQLEFIIGDSDSIKAFNGDDFSIVWRYSLSYTTNLLLGDIDGDRKLEIIASKGEYVYAIDVQSSGARAFWKCSWIENSNSRNLLKIDPDEDWLSSDSERIFGTDNFNNDTDGDGIPDGWEVSNGLDPLSNDSSLDLDEDGLSNLMEYEYKTNPVIKDTDFDDLSDYEELFVYGTNPLSKDSDGDWFTDGFEVRYHLDPVNSWVPWLYILLATLVIVTYSVYHFRLTIHDFIVTKVVPLMNNNLLWHRVIYWAGFINVFFQVISVLSYLINPWLILFFFIPLILSIPSILVWRYFVKGNKIAIIIQIIVLSIVAVTSGLITIHLSIYGSLTKLYALGPSIYDSLTIAPILFSFIGIGPGVFLIILLFTLPIFLWTLGWNFYEVVIGPIALSLSLLYLLIVAIYLRSINLSQLTRTR